MAHRTDQPNPEPSPTASRQDESLAAWLSADDLHAEMARTRANAAARCGCCTGLAVTA